MRQSAEEYVKTLESACSFWKIRQGRAREYVRRLIEFYQTETLTPEHLLAYYESFEIAELFELWKDHIDAFPGIEKKIRKACEKGPFLREDEAPGTSSNRPRNDAFCYLVAGKFLSASISVVSIDGLPSRHFAYKTSADFAFLWDAKLVSVECKRPQTQKALPKLVAKARDQIIASGLSGVVAIDCSVVCRPNGTVLEASTPRKAEYQLYKWLRYEVYPKIRSRLSEQVLGVLLYSRIPAMTATNLVDSRGESFRRRDCISSWLAVGSRTNQDCEILRNVANMLNAQKTPE